MRYLCDICFDGLTPHLTSAYNGGEMAVCDDCLAPPADHACWWGLTGVEVPGIFALVASARRRVVRRALALEMLAMSHAEIEAFLDSVPDEPLPQQDLERAMAYVLGRLRHEERR